MIQDEGLGTKLSSGAGRPFSEQVGGLQVGHGLGEGSEGQSLGRENSGARLACLGFA